MTTLIINENDSGQRLDRFLKKYLKGASLSYLYKVIRKDVKINGRRGSVETVLNTGDEIALYISDEELAKLTENNRQNPSHTPKARRQFKIAYEDDNILVAEKPFGLLTHGTQREKKNTLVNQVVDYLIEKGDYNPRAERTFVPAAVNRLDRNTTGLVVFGKNSDALRTLNQMIREKGCVSKYYLTIVAGKLDRDLHLVDRMVKDQATNTVTVLRNGSAGSIRVQPTRAAGNFPGAGDETGEGKTMETCARPVAFADGYTLVEVELVTGRTHQIRAHMAKAGFPVIGDSKYGRPGPNAAVQKRFGLTTQFLHAYRLEFKECPAPLEYMNGVSVLAELTPDMKKIAEALFGKFNVGDVRKMR